MTLEDFIKAMMLWHQKDYSKNMWIQQSCASDKQVLVIGSGTKDRQGDDCFEVDVEVRK